MALENFVSTQETANFTQTPQGQEINDITAPLKELFPNTTNEYGSSIVRLFSTSGKEYLLMKKNNVIVAVETDKPKNRNDKHSRSFMFRDGKIYEGKVLFTQEQSEQLVGNILEAERNTPRPRS